MEDLEQWIIYTEPTTEPGPSVRMYDGFTNDQICKSMYNHFGQDMTWKCVVFETITYNIPNSYRNGLILYRHMTNNSPQQRKLIKKWLKGQKMDRTLKWGHIGNKKSRWSSFKSSFKSFPFIELGLALYTNYDGYCLSLSRTWLSGDMPVNTASHFICYENIDDFEQLIARRY